jgi:hypothetical protein
MSTRFSCFSLIGALLTVLLTASTLAQLGKTADECTKFYGRPLVAAMTSELTPPARSLYQYFWHGFNVRAQFVGRDVKDSRCGYVTYSTIYKPDGSIRAMTDAEIQSLLALNGNGSKWEVVPWNRSSWERAWKRSDNRAFAVESKYTNNGVPDNGLAIISADFLKDSKAFAEVKAMLSAREAK